MSDGPHKSLPMRKPWKGVAEVADSDASTMPEVLPRLLNALSADWREEINAGLIANLRNIFDGADQLAMFPEQRRAQLEGLAREATGRPLAQILIECADRALAAGLYGVAALEDTAQRALELRVRRGIRQVEEHYLRKSNEPRAARVRDKLEAAAAACDLGSWGRRLTGIEHGATTVRAIKQDGLDDGAPL